MACKLSRCPPRLGSGITGWAARTTTRLGGKDHYPAERLPFTPVPLLAGYAAAGTRFRG